MIQANYHNLFFKRKKIKLNINTHTHTDKEQILFTV